MKNGEPRCFGIRDSIDIEAALEYSIAAPAHVPETNRSRLGIAAAAFTRVYHMTMNKQ